MELTLTNREQSGWRGRGRPAKPIPADLLMALQRAARTGEYGIIDTRDATDAEARQVLRWLRAGARQLSRRIVIQHDDGQIRFHLGETA